LFLAHLSHRSSFMSHTHVMDDGEVTMTVSEQAHTLLNEEDMKATVIMIESASEMRERT
jgi:hypothetical protein